jgi:hypothetical protein
MIHKIETGFGVVELEVAIKDSKSTISLGVTPIKDHWDREFDPLRVFGYACGDLQPFLAFNHGSVKTLEDSPTHKVYEVHGEAAEETVRDDFKDVCHRLFRPWV